MGLISPIKLTIYLSLFVYNLIEFLGVSYFLGLFGPAIGFALSSYCLTIYISPYLTPVINMDDPRWLGAYWMGKLVHKNISLQWRLFT